MELTFEAMMLGDWEAVRAIYREGIDSGNATFETDVPTWEQWPSGRDCGIGPGWFG